MSRLDQLFSTLRTSASGLAAERVRVGVIAENIAGARITKTPEGGPYRRKVVLFEPLLDSRMGGSASARGVRAAPTPPRPSRTCTIRRTRTPTSTATCGCRTSIR
jgi:flagellar basal-body rod protein FlgC